MKISSDTLTVLKNFASINQALLVRKGDVLQTISPQNIIVSEAIVDDSFPQDFAIYDLNKLINVESLLEEPDFSFKKTNLHIVSGNRSVNYIYADPSNIHTLPEGLKEKLASYLSKAEISFKFSEDDFSGVLKASSVMGFEHLVVVGNGEVISLVAESSGPKKKTQGNFVISLQDTTIHTFKIVFNIEHLKLLPGNYDVNISSKGIGHFQNKDVQVEYWITAQKELTEFGE